MLHDERLEDLSMRIIAGSGAARARAFEAIALAKSGGFGAARAKLAEAAEASRQAHDSHSALLQMDARGEVPGADLLLVHAQDHWMAATLALELITEMIGMLETFGVREKGMNR
jgi:PTS system cellobiose-specific IIA component